LGRSDLEPAPTGVLQTIGQRGQLIFREDQAGPEVARLGPIHPVARCAHAERDGADRLDRELPHLHQVIGRRRLLRRGQHSVFAALDYRIQNAPTAFMRSRFSVVT